MKQRQPFSAYDYQPPEMIAYLRHNGWHFSSRMCSFAVSLMRKNGKPITPLSKEEVDRLLLKYDVRLENSVGYDYVYVANMCTADFYGSSIIDERAFAIFIKDYIDDPDQPDGFVFNRFYADCSMAGIPIPWEHILNA